MNQAAVAPLDLRMVHVGEMLALPSIEPERGKKRLSADASEIVGAVATIIDGLLASVITRRTSADFIDVRSRVFPQYFNAVRAVSDLAVILVPHEVREVLMAESFSETEARIREHGLAAFGSAIRDQAVFTVWTLRKIGDLCGRIDKSPLPAECRESDAEMFESFLRHAIGARFHLDCLLKSMSLQQPLYPDVLDVVMDGLRAAVNAYAWARRAFDLRVPATESNEPSSEWDDEDRQLLNEATWDVVTEP